MVVSFSLESNTLWYKIIASNIILPFWLIMGEAINTSRISWKSSLSFSQLVLCWTGGGRDIHFWRISGWDIAPVRFHSMVVVPFHWGALFLFRWSSDIIYLIRKTTDFVGLFVFKRSYVSYSSSSEGFSYWSYSWCLVNISFVNGSVWEMKMSK